MEGDFVVSFGPVGLTALVFGCFSYRSARDAVSVVLHYETLADDVVLGAALEHETREAKETGSRFRPLNAVRNKVRWLLAGYLFVHAITLIGLVAWLAPPQGGSFAKLLLATIAHGLFFWSSFATLYDTFSSRYQAGSDAWEAVGEVAEAPPEVKAFYEQALALIDTPDGRDSASPAWFQRLLPWTFLTRKLAAAQLRSLRWRIREIGGGGAILEALSDYFIKRYHDDEIKRCGDEALVPPAEATKTVVTCLDQWSRDVLDRAGVKRRKIDPGTVFLAVARGAPLLDRQNGVVVVPRQRFDEVYSSLARIGSGRVPRAKDRRGARREKVRTGLRHWHDKPFEWEKGQHRYGYVDLRGVDEGVDDKTAVAVSYKGRIRAGAWDTFWQFVQGRRATPRRFSEPSIYHRNKERAGSGRPIARRTRRGWFGRVYEVVVVYSHPPKRSPKP